MILSPTPWSWWASSAAAPCRHPRKF